VAVIVDPALDVGIEHPRQIGKGLVAPTMECPPSDRLSDLLSAPSDWQRAETKRHVDGPCQSLEISAGADQGELRIDLQIGHRPLAISQGLQLLGYSRG
jgi:hypothetical protein